MADVAGVLTLRFPVTEESGEGRQHSGCLGRGGGGSGQEQGAVPDKSWGILGFCGVAQVWNEAFPGQQAFFLLSASVATCLP